MIVQSQEGAQYSRNTAMVKKLLRNNETPSKQEETVTEANHEQEEPIHQQSVFAGAKCVETKVPLGRHAAAEPEVHSGGRRDKVWITIPDSKRH